MDELTQQEFVRDFTKSTNGRILIGLLTVIVVFFFGWIVSSVYKDKKQTDDLIKREISGVLIEIENATHGIYGFKIRQHTSGKELNYYLHASKFVRENSIQKGDSIAKESNSNTISFFKKANGSFQKCCELEYY